MYLSLKGSDFSPDSVLYFRRVSLLGLDTKFEFIALEFDEKIKIKI